MKPFIRSIKRLIKKYKFSQKNKITSILFTPQPVQLNQGFFKRVKLYFKKNPKEVHRTLAILMVVIMLFTVTIRILSKISPNTVTILKFALTIEEKPKVVTGTETNYKYVVKGTLKKEFADNSFIIGNHAYVLHLDAVFTDEGRISDVNPAPKKYTVIQILQPENKEFKLNDFINKHVEIKGVSAKKNSDKLIIMPDTIKFE